ncbi:MAG: carboxylating nicotinate-nucleotide diphosphorylase [Leptolyngbya foveolarum]|uniref:Probable nicotinate-nucleotide pyrophosphorylase [carboxylating] n=1 Tax=Leptolyngbya foveolarum TaxID=47253 RepID=A0A2W4TPG3_9CYAN|nr:MAG: carboxylating nicotinate-nucleotide diphosphorylase [Leptolyngbya foveolarum]
MLPAWIVLDELLALWLKEDVGRGDQATQGLGKLALGKGRAYWVAKEAGVIAGLPVAGRVFYLLEPQQDFRALVEEGAWVEKGTRVAEIDCRLSTLLTGERVALNLAMRLSGIATMTKQFVDEIAAFPAQLVDTRKTTPGLRILEKHATFVGGAQNHRMGLDDGVMIKDNHIAAAGGIGAAVSQVRGRIPYPVTVEVETESLEQVAEAIAHKADIIMLDNMPIGLMKEAVGLIRTEKAGIKIEASGNVSLETIRAIAQTGVDYISSSAPVTRSPWLDISMRIES